MFFLKAFKTHNPQFSVYDRHVREAVVTGEREVTFTFDGSPPRAATDSRFSSRYCRDTGGGADKSERRRQVADTTLEPPLGSRPYRIKTFEAGNSFVYERVTEYWSDSLSVRVGRNNFDALRFDNFRDSTVELQADDFDWHVENIAKN